LAVTDAAGGETCFGFMQFHSSLVDESGITITPLPTSDRWTFKDFIDTPDPRYRAIIREFEQAGYLVSDKDEFASVS
jgi:hypothetical protein